MTRSQAESMRTDMLDALTDRIDYDESWTPDMIDRELNGIVDAILNTLWPDGQ